MRRTILPLILGGALAVAAVGPAAAAPVAVGGNSLIGVIVQLEDVLNDADIDVITIDINDSLNNALQNAFQNANIEVLTNSLNNVLNNLDVDVTITDITVVGDSIVISVLGGDTIVLS